MAPELRARKPSASAQKTPIKSKGAAPVKRKAAEDASPVAVKKTKPLKGPATSKAKKEKPVVPVEPVVDDEEQPSSDDDEEDNDQALVLAGVSDEEDDAEVDESAAFKEGQDVGKAPVPSKALEKAGKSGKGGSKVKAVVYIGRIPHGFYERQMQEYFGQFGDISRLRLSRNKKTGQSKHFAFVEFADETTAEYVVKSMNNYLLFGHLLKCRTVPESQIHDDLFKGAGKRYKAIPSNKIEGNKLKKPLSEGKWASKIEKENKKRAEKAEKLKALGYEFEAPELKEAVAPTAGALEDAQEEAPKAVEAAPQVAESEAVAETADGEQATTSGTPSKQNGSKAGKKAKKPAKAKKAKA
ncbi:hypothetical protein BKA67DRAFT_552949 [Truncatella angustata]|uniref:RRM domain-containing protein n=1 Tax=Truncatella angustata TaxID=152316 RepID=A0A9P9A136_9PEZI|nr:uncharacterized protein BKA67DRAFT_552949 [Truncatella angustata]KAH6656751.1 hypothetical protein BKA67DRAFT_552949 [Truncatella angustata]KAH8200466.1 hypothetical protein TruAng_005359 [Truncatella angustata]